MFNSPEMFEYLVFSSKTVFSWLNQFSLRRHHDNQCIAPKPIRRASSEPMNKNSGRHAQFIFWLPQTTRSSFKPNLLEGLTHRLVSSSNFQAAQLFSMARLFCLLNVTTIAVVCIWCSAGLTFQDSKLPGFVIKTFKSTDWLHCLEECNNNDDCVSYNYNRLGSNCELQNFSPKIRCHANEYLVAFQGWIHHTLDPSKVGQNISVLNFFFNSWSFGKYRIEETLSMYFKLVAMNS